MLRGRQQPTFVELVEQHERVWGTENYPGRPKLSQILASPVVVFWKSIESKDNRYTVTLHNDLNAVEKHLYRTLFLDTEPPKKRPARIFQNQKRMMIKAVQIVFAPAEE
jgi:hypothetical protein